MKTVPAIIGVGIGHDEKERGQRHRGYTWTINTAQFSRDSTSKNSPQPINSTMQPKQNYPQI